jgi:Peptidase A4 family
MRKLVLAASILVALLAAGAARAGGAVEVSTNWSGYALVGSDPATPVAFSDVTGSWVEPKATCTSGRRDASAFWVGIGGYSDSASSLEQLGTAAECNGANAKATHYAWWEIVPAPAVKIPLKILAGDTVTAAVVVDGQKVTLFLKDATRKTRFSKTITTAQILDTSSAEWIAEAPSECSSGGRCNVVPLTNFGTVTFTKAATIANSHPGTLVDATVDATAPWLASGIELIPQTTSLFGKDDVLGSGVGAVPGAVSTDGRSFSVSWQRGLTPPTG